MAPLSLASAKMCILIYWISESLQTLKVNLVMMECAKMTALEGGGMFTHKTGPMHRRANCNLGHSSEQFLYHSCFKPPGVLNS